MTFVNTQSGAQIAEVLPGSSSKFADTRADIRSLADILEHLNGHPTPHTAMLRTTAGKIAAFLGKTVNEVSLDLIYMNREGFRPFLVSQRFKEQSVRSYVNYLRMLLEEATELGWRPYSQLPCEWLQVVELARKKDCLSITKWLAQLKQSPEDVTEQDVERWLEQRTIEGMGYASAKCQANAVWRALIACGYTKNAPIANLRKKNYGVPLSKMPMPLRDEVTELLRWKSAEFEPERPKRAQVREVSANHIRRMLSCLYGFATKIANLGEFNTLERLVQKPVVAGYISWCINDQNVKGAPLVPQLGAVHAAVSQHPAHKGIDLSWFRPLLEAIPIDTYAEEVKARKAKKYLEYEVLESIPAKIHATRSEATKYGEEYLARLVMGELMVAWLLVFPWRQRNIRECRVTGPNPNLFKARVPAFSYIDKPAWACSVEAANPNAEFWQVKFSSKETKTKVPIHSLVPRHLIGLLEEYLSNYRPVLLKGRRCNTLFVRPEAEEVGSGFVTDTISELTLRYGGRRVTPHLFRDIVAFAWLKAHPQDYLTLAKMLWHKNVSTTINHYGSRFNESSASVAMESWHEQRAKRSS